MLDRLLAMNLMALEVGADAVEGIFEVSTVGIWCAAIVPSAGVSASVASCHPLAGI